MFKRVLISGVIVLMGGYVYYKYKSEDIEIVNYKVQSRKNT